MKISVAQALLILLDCFKDTPQAYEELKRLYLSGAKNPEYHKLILYYLGEYQGLIYDYLNKQGLIDIEISSEPKVIDDDNSRRYFETQLAYETLKSNLWQFSLEEINYYLEEVQHLVDDAFKGLWDDVIHDHCGASDNVEREFSNVLTKLDKNEIFSNPDFSAQDRKKISGIFKSAYVATIIAANTVDVLPLDIYSEGFYAEKGKILKRNQEKTSTLAYGLLKGYSPVPYFDIALMHNPQTFQKASDQATYDPDKAWVRHNFYQLVHPYSNAISGTLLAQIRVVLKMLDNYQLDKSLHPDLILVPDKLQAFITSLISALLFNSGGHSLYEFTALFGIKKVQEAFKGRNNVPSYDLEYLFLTANSQGFEKALQLAIDYNKRLLSLGRVNQSIKVMKIESTMDSLIASINHSSFSKYTKERFLKILRRDLEQASHCFFIAQQLINLINNNESRVEGEYFSSYRQGFVRHKVLKENLSHAISQLSQSNLVFCKKILNDTITELEEFQTKNYSLFFKKQIPELESLKKLVTMIDSMVDVSEHLSINKNG